VSLAEKLKIKSTVHFLITDQDHGIMRRQGFFVEKIRESIILVGETRPAIKFSFGF
jgi:hypothetical protein